MEIIGLSMDFVRKFGRWFIYMILGIAITMLCLWLFVYAQSYMIVNDRLNDLVLTASEENCLSDDGTSGSSLDHFEKMLQNSETTFLKFTVSNESTSKDFSTKFDKNLAYYVGEMQPNISSNGKTYYSYLTAPQRGNGLEIRVKGIVSLPIFFRGDGNTFASFQIPIVRQATSMALKFYKDK